MAISAHEENLIDLIPDLRKDVDDILASVPISPPGNLAYLATLDPSGGTKVISDTERTNFQWLYDGLSSADLSVLSSITSVPGSCILSNPEQMILKYVTDTTYHSNDPDWDEMRITETQFNAHLTDTTPHHPLHHDHVNWGIIDNISDLGSSKIITDTERTNFQAIYDDYIAQLPSGFTEVRNHIDATDIHHIHANKTILDNITITQLLADEVNKRIILGNILILYGVVNIDSLSNLGAGECMVPDTDIVFVNGFLNIPAVVISLSDEVSGNKDADKINYDVSSNGSGISIRLTNISEKVLTRRNFVCKWIAFGEI